MESTFGYLHTLQELEMETRMALVPNDWEAAMSDGLDVIGADESMTANPIRLERNDWGKSAATRRGVSARDRTGALRSRSGHRLGTLWRLVLRFTGEDGRRTRIDFSNGPLPESIVAAHDRTCDRMRATRNRVREREFRWDYKAAVHRLVMILDELPGSGRTLEDLTAGPP